MVEHKVVPVSLVVCRVHENEVTGDSEYPESREGQSWRVSNVVTWSLGIVSHG